jgi:hypothetical protein
VRLVAVEIPGGTDMNRLQLSQSDFKDIRNNKWFAHLTEEEKSRREFEIWKRNCPVGKLMETFNAIGGGI